LSTRQIKLLRGSGFLYGRNLIEALKIVFPNEEWGNKDLFSRRNKKSRQRWLFLKVQEIFDSHEIFEDFKHKEMSQKAGYSIELDLFIPKLNLAFEYQGEHHYEENPKGGFGSFESQQFRDQKKKQICSEHGIELIIIPYWWENKIESLKSTIFKEYPNISLEKKKFKEVTSTSNSKYQLKNLINVTLAQVWNAELNPSGYWMSEKYDGIRAIWKDNSLFSRHGIKFHVPSW